MWVNKQATTKENRNKLGRKIEQIAPAIKKAITTTLNNKINNNIRRVNRRLSATKNIRRGHTATFSAHTEFLRTISILFDIIPRQLSVYPLRNVVFSLNANQRIDWRCISTLLCFLLRHCVFRCKRCHQQNSSRGYHRWLSRVSASAAALSTRHTALPAANESAAVRSKMRTRGNYAPQWGGKLK